MKASLSSERAASARCASCSAGRAHPVFKMDEAFGWPVSVFGGRMILEVICNTFTKHLGNSTAHSVEVLSIWNGKIH